MAKKQFFCIIDTETTQDALVADFAAVICDRKGKIYAQCAVLVNGIFTEQENHPLFWQHGDKNDVFSKASLPRRYERYNNMVKDGQRMIASTGAINRWIAKAVGQYDPILTAYNLAFDMDKCKNTGIDLTQFSSNFCLWHSAFTHLANTKNYKNFVLQCHAFNTPTKHGNMSFKTNAEVMTRFVLGQPDLEDEPHTALEDIVYYELPILKHLLTSKSVKKVTQDLTPFNWREVQVSQHFKAK